MLEIIGVVSAVVLVWGVMEKYLQRQEARERMEARLDKWC